MARLSCIINDYPLNAHLCVTRTVAPAIWERQGSHAVMGGGVGFFTPDQSVNWPTGSQASRDCKRFGASRILPYSPLLYSTVLVMQWAYCDWALVSQCTRVPRTPYGMMVRYGTSRLFGARKVGRRGHPQDATPYTMDTFSVQYCS